MNNLLFVSALVGLPFSFQFIRKTKTWQHAMTGEHSSVGGKFPHSIAAELAGCRHKWKEPKKLGRGSFGEAWEATGKVTVDGDRAQHRVVLKLFYRNEGRNESVTYLTPDNLRRNERDEVLKIKKECAFVQTLHRIAKAIGDPAKDRFVPCHKVEATDSGSSPMYAILGVGGQSLDQWKQERATRTRSSSLARTQERGRRIIANLLQGQRFMSETLPIPLTHHDLKPANAVFDESTNTAMFIDFGAALEVETDRKKQDAQSVVATPMYTAPEYLGLPGIRGSPRAYCPETPWSYDVFALGMMYAEFMCPQANADDLIRYARTQDRQKQRASREFLRLSRCKVPSADIKLMEKMMSFDCAYRPRPSEILKQAPFLALAEELGEFGKATVDTSEERDGLKAAVEEMSSIHTKTDEKKQTEMMAAIQTLDKFFADFGIEDADPDANTTVAAEPPAKERTTEERQQATTAAKAALDGFFADLGVK